MFPITPSGEALMRKAAEEVSWVVYKVNDGKLGEVKAVCGQSEWDAMELERPGHHELVLGGITNEGEAERLARGTAGEKNLRLPRR
jgi:hypothetical protein